MSMVLDGKTLAKEVEKELAERVQKVVEHCGMKPRLAVIIVGTDYASQTYVRMKCNATNRIGLESMKIEMPESTTTEELLDLMANLNADPTVCGIMLQHPIPRHIDERRVMDAISVNKDVDGLNSASFGRMSLQIPSFAPATALSIMTILRRYNIELQGKNVVVIGRSSILGKPVALLLLNANATVTICHSKTVDLPSIVKQADVIVAAVGKPKFVKAEWIKEGAVIVDAGYNEGNVGDVDLENAISHCSAYTPVPGGVGPMTIAMLLEQTVISAEKMYK